MPLAYIYIHMDPIRMLDRKPLQLRVGEHRDATLFGVGPLLLAHTADGKPARVGSITPWLQGAEAKAASWQLQVACCPALAPCGIPPREV